MKTLRLQRRFPKAGRGGSILPAALLWKGKLHIREFSKSLRLFKLLRIEYYTLMALQGKRLTLDIIIEIRKRRERGEAVDSIAAALDISHTTVEKYIYSGPTYDKKSEMQVGVANSKSSKRKKGTPYISPVDGESLLLFPGSPVSGGYWRFGSGSRGNLHTFDILPSL